MFFFLFFLAQIHIGVMTGAPHDLDLVGWTLHTIVTVMFFSESNKVIGLQVSMHDSMIFIYPSNNGPPSTISSIFTSLFHWNSHWPVCIMNSGRHCKCNFCLRYKRPWTHLPYTKSRSALANTKKIDKVKIHGDALSFENGSHLNWDPRLKPPICKEFHGQFNN
jgi:hypothetical protein